MAIHLLLYGEEDERMLLDYIVKPPVYICGIDTDDEGQPLHRLSVDEVIELGYSDALSFGIVHPELGTMTSVRDSKRRLTWKTEVMGHQDFVKRNRGENIIDIFLSPIITYSRPYNLGTIITEALLVPNGAEANPAVNKWYQRIYAWCRRKGTNVFSLKEEAFPGQFISEWINTRWAFPSALRELQSGRTFCRTPMSLEALELARERTNKWRQQRDS